MDDNQKYYGVLKLKLSDERIEEAIISRGWKGKYLNGNIINPTYANFPTEWAREYGRLYNVEVKQYRLLPPSGNWGPWIDL